MRIAIIGAGAMGSLLGHGFCRAGHDVSLLDTGHRVAQLRAAGRLRVVDAAGAESTAEPRLISADPAALGSQDVVVLATKAQQLPAVAPAVSRMVDADSVIVTIQNGIPWWYLYGLPGYAGRERIRCLDPHGVLDRCIDTRKVVGCVAYPAATLEADGRCHHVEGVRFPVGELDGGVRERTELLAGLFQEAGFKSRVLEDIRSEIWLKAWGALSINPVSALSRATMEEICTFPESRELVAAMMAEAQGVAEALGARFRHTIEKRIEGARAVGAHKTSMLQDVEAGRPLELDALMLAVLELARLVQVETPLIRAVYACTALLNHNLSAARDAEVA